MLAMPMSASATPPGGSDLDRLSGTQALIPQASDDAPPADEAAPPGPPPDAPPVPLDGGLSLLALAGAGYAAKRLRKRRA